MMSDGKGVVVSLTSDLIYKQMFELRQSELAATNHVMTRHGPSADIRPQRFALALAPSICTANPHAAMFFLLGHCCSSRSFLRP
jgi:hypothetical protein